MALGNDDSGSGVKNAGQSGDRDSSAASVNSNTESAPAGRRQQKRDQAELRALLAPLNKAIAKHEKQLVVASRTLSEVREKLGAEELYNAENKTQLNDLLNAEATARLQVEALEEQLLDSMEALEQATATHSP